MNTPKFKLSVFFALILALFFVSCQEDALLDMNDEALTVEEMSEDEVYYATAAAREHENHDHGKDFRFKRMCLKPVFPLELIFPDSSTQEVQNLRELKAAFIKWKREGNDGRPRIAFPHEVELPDGNVITVENREDLRALIRQCLKKVRPKLDSCYQLVFPLEVELGDGSQQTVDSKEELNALIRDWAQNHRDSLPRPKLVFPLEIVLQDGTVQTVDSPQELAEITKDCLPERKKCFEWVFPITISLGDKEVIVRSPQQLKALFMRYAHNRNLNVRPRIVYPQDIQLSNGDVVTLESPEDLREVLRDCFHD